MRSSHLHWLLVILLLTDTAVGHRLSGPPPSSSMRLAAPAPPGQASVAQDTQSLLSALTAAADGRVRFHGNVSCRSLRRLPHGDSLISRELLGLAELPLLVSAGCHQEALALTHSLYKVLGREDTQTLIRQLTQLLKNSPTLATLNNLHLTPNSSVSADDSSDRSEPSTYNTFNSNGSSVVYENITDLNDNSNAHHLEANPQSNTMDDRTQAEGHLNALMFNIQQLARVGAEGASRGADGGSGSCAGWLHVQGAELLGQRVGKRGHLHKAQSLCQRLGPKCLSVAQSGDPTARMYQAVLRQGSRVLPSHSDLNAECWLRQCAPEVSLGLERVRRSTRFGQHRCVSPQEQQVYAVVEWVPAVSTLYNLGTAVYYAARNCTDTARQRAILSAVDLGTDALMAITGGTVGVAGYALGAGVKTGVKASVKYLLNNVNQNQGYDPSQDVLVNQESLEDGTFTIQ